MENKIKYTFEAKYFNIDDISVDTQHKEEFKDDSKLVYAQIEATFDRENFEKHNGSNRLGPSNKGKHLMIFNDKSNRMSGKAFTAL